MAVQGASTKNLGLQFTQKPVGARFSLEIKDADFVQPFPITGEPQLLISTGNIAEADLDVDAHPKFTRVVNLSCPIIKQAF